MLYSFLVFSEQVDKWEKIAPGLFEALKDEGNEDSDCCMNIDENASVEEVIENILNTFYKNIEDGKYKEAVAVYRLAEKRWPEHFCASGIEEDNEESEELGNGERE